ncbi:class I SAM-dependent methyltransferase [Candidatus Pelagibacter sp. Uisw_127]|uniref:class I SAM-dependent methyltransferase n=1 Tax=Candidatus Pelagibacter sp. Uisw_127 TaxID=3230988 RepID=UPI0039EBD3ED
MSNFLIIIILIILYYYNKKKIRRLFKKKIKSVEIENVHEIFKPNKITDNLLGPSDDLIIKSFSIPQSYKIVGMTTDYESWILSCLSKISKNIFEFGTCSGKNTYLMALNSSQDTKIISLTLSQEQSKNLNLSKKDNNISIKNILKESNYEKFLFSGKKVQSKIDIIFIDSREFKTVNFLKKFDLIFIDGGHTYSVVKNDSEKAFEMLSYGGIIIWHDYVVGKESSKDVCKYIHELEKEKKIYHIKNTSMCYYKNNL